MKCRFCGSDVTLPFVDLVNAPPSNSFLRSDQLFDPEMYYPLKIFVCENCWLVQVDEYKSHEEIFKSDYAYYSSFSQTWLRHCETYVDQMVKRLDLDENSFVGEVASNDGYLLQNFVKLGIPCLGIEPSSGTAAAAREKGVQTVERFWGEQTALDLKKQRGQFDLIAANNVLAHVPDINDFVKGFAIGLKPTGTLTIEFPHILNLIKYRQFDTIYHEHYSYLSLTTVKDILLSHGLVVYHVDELPTHGGSLRVYARHENAERIKVTSEVQRILDIEVESGLRDKSGYQSMQRSVDQIREEAIQFLYAQKKEGSRVAAYGAAAKGNTFINYCGIKGNDLIDFVVDLSPHKQGLFLPGSHIPIVPESRIREVKPDFIVILPWNLREEIERQLSYIKEWNGQFVTFIPHLMISN